MAKPAIKDRRPTEAEAADARRQLSDALARRKASKTGVRSAEAPGPANVYDLIALNRLVDELRATRESQGLSLADVSERTGIDRASLNKIETRKNQNPTYGTLARYAAAVGRSLTMGLIAR
ncbi:MAG: helix-turn-helix transcriptional regulator [Planctomycetota bacterium]|nr:helix-turn-helix transcriptional regulator [Planctomycetaceae bacterium]MDQ3329506.1 helix-turn-helix transcriptional regulator [Planctomycetota bacterium]